MNNNEILTTRELSIRLGVSLNTLGKWRKAGMPYMQPVKLIRYNWDDVESWLKCNGKNVEKK